MLDPRKVLLVDRYIGIPVCFVLTIVRKVANLFKRQPAQKKIEKILFIKLTELGALVICHKAIARAVEMVGRENVYFVVFEESRELVEVLDCVPSENVITVKSSGILSTVRDLLSVLKRLRSMKFSATVDMEFFSRASAIIGYLTGAPLRSGHHRYTAEGPYRGNLLTHRVAYKFYLHTAGIYYSLVEALNHDVDDLPMLKIKIPENITEAPPLFKPTQQQKDNVDDILKDAAGLTEVSHPLILVNASTSDILPLRRWSEERFVELCKRLIDNHRDITIALTGRTVEYSLCSEIVDKIGSDRVINIAGKTSLMDIFTLFTMADLLISNDSGPGHFASMTDLETISLFGTDTPVLWRPLGEKNHPLCADLACSPCMNVFNHRFSSCKDNKCMQAITVDEVYELADRLLKEQN